ncbi:toxin Doc [Streptomyces sp. R41]|uniref:Toxin Doc n=1 Tax=Streptomyces sp. R41 TaxID=3238632 RepID=A0AB39R658_9ACTN
MAARHKVDPPRHDQHHPDAFWRAAVFLEECVLLRPLPARNEFFGYSVAIAYLEASEERVDTKFELWRELIHQIRALRLDSYEIAERLRSWRAQ